MTTSQQNEETRVVHLPKVSVCIPTYNGARYIEAAIESVLAQDYCSFEIVIVDNCSTDATKTIVFGYLSRNDKIRFFENAENIGLTANFNRCLDYAQGQYIKYLCVDDVLLPGCLQQMASELDVHPDVSLVCGGRLSIDDTGRSFGQRRYSERPGVFPGHSVITRCLYGGNFIGEPTAVMFRKSDAHSRFRTTLPQLMDMDMWFHLLEQGALSNIGAPVCAVRFHNMQMTHKNIESGKLIEDNISLFNEFSKKPYLLTTPWLKIRHRLMMTYRVWISRQFLEPTSRQNALGEYGIVPLYYLMPIVSGLVRLTRKIQSMY
ncbi:glycosyltransferase family 2 protein [Rhizobium ruizarguesonis]